MEILNNIWNILTTENEAFISLITSPCMFIELYLSFYLFTIILKIDYTRSQKIAYVLILSIVGILLSLFIPSPFNTFINYIIFFIFIKYVFKTSVLKTILSIVIPFAIFGIINTLLMNPFIKILNISFEILNTVPIYKIAYLCFVYIIVTLIILLLEHRKFTFVIHSNLDKRTNSTIILNLILGILTLCIQLVLTVYYINLVPIIITLLNFITLFSYFFFSFYTLTRVMKLHVATRDLENAESYNNSLTVLYDNVKGFKHDFDNMVNIIGGYIDVNDMEGLRKYYDDLEKDCVRVRNIQLLNPNIINNPGIYNLIVSKYKKATDLNITINFEFFFDFDNLHMPIYEFSKILGILLDNAIEASKDCENKEINLLFRESRKQNVQIVSIENTYSNKDVDTKKIFEKGVSGKENHTGIGLWEVNQIIKKNNNIVLHTTKNDDYFKQELQIYF